MLQVGPSALPLYLTERPAHLPPPTLRYLYQTLESIQHQLSLPCPPSHITGRPERPLRHYFQTAYHYVFLPHTPHNNHTATPS